MTEETTDRALAARSAVSEHLAKRLAEATAKIKGTDSASEKARADVRKNYELLDLIETALSSLGQIQLASHLLKPTYPDGKVRLTSNLKVRPSALSKTEAVGSHVLPEGVVLDSTGNGAYVKKIYEVGRLLDVSFEGQSLLHWLLVEDADVSFALGCIGPNASSIRTALTSVFEERCPRPSSHSRAKQLYWLAGVDAHDEQAFHLLAPLYPTALVHRVYQQLQDDRFSDDAKAARAARKTGEHHERPVREYPKLAIQKLGGTKPQNISQLNSERRGDNCLLASLPPVWESADVRALLHVDSLFKVFGRRKEVKQQAFALKRLLQANPAPNQDTRRQVTDWLMLLIDELVFFQAELSGLQPGWSLSADCELPLAQRIWLDPEADRPDGPQMYLADAADEIAEGFARWVNGQLRDPLPVGEAEFIAWRKLARDEFAAMAREAA